MLADDEALELTYLTRTLEESGRYSVLAAVATGQELLKAARSRHPQIILVDISMPGVSGLEVAVQLRSELPESVIILNTAYAEFDFAVQAVNHHLDAYLLKPSNRETILSTLEKCLEARGMTEPDAAVPAGLSACTKVVSGYIDQHFREDLSLNGLAALVFFSPSHLSRTFNKECGMTINAYINRQRVAEAVRLLKSTAFSVQEIAQRCGFSNISHFNRVFKEVSGRSPMQLRREGEHGRA